VIETKENRCKNQVTLKILAQHLGLAPGTVSKVLNNASGSEVIPQLTKTRIRAAARELQYRPNLLAQSMRTKRTYMIGVLVPEIGNPDGALLITGVERVLRQRGYLFTTGVHQNNSEMLETYASLFLRRGVEGLITMNVDFPYSSLSPTVAIAIPRRWTTEDHSAMAVDFDSWGRSSMQSRRFLEQVGETATETLIGQIEGPAEDLSDLTSSPALAARDSADPTPSMPDG
jgi:DNA-binding LacI/PurR family transcriptional regulator